MRKKQESTASDDKTADETVIGERCPLPPNTENDLKMIARQLGVTKCEQLEKFVVQGIEFKKLEAECAQGVKDDRCKYISPPK
jgi:hypothetical protein